MMTCERPGSAMTPHETSNCNRSAMASFAASGGSAFRVIVADPPWKFGNRAYQDNGRPPIEADAHYPVMTTKEICALPVREKADKDSALLMWTTDAHLPDALEVMKAWGFEYRTVAFVWLKQYHTGTPCVLVAPWTLKSTELCLLGVRGSPKRAAKNIRALIAAERTRHSKKPDEAMERIEALFGDVPRLELFARRKRHGWASWGNELANDVEMPNGPDQRPRPL